MNGYLFVHFIGEQADGEQVYFSVSEDGLHFRDLNGGKPVLRSNIGDKGVRDPFLVRHPHTGHYYLIATDLSIYHRQSWESAQFEGSRDLTVWESDDLVIWQGPRAVTVGIPEAGCVWAPEAIWDEGRGEFLVFFASMVKEAGDDEAKQRIYSAWTKDFVTFTTTRKYMEEENHLIDLNIIHVDGWYYRFVKDETTKTIRMERMRDLLGPAEPIYSDVLANLYGVEGPECYHLPDGRWCLMVDQFAKGWGYLPLLENDLASGSFTPMDRHEYHLGETKKRHGGILPIDGKALERLVRAFGN